MQLPKLSQIIANLRPPEEQFESMAQSAGFPVPKGPMGVLSEFAASFEASAPEIPTLAGAPELPEFKLPELPAPPAGGAAGLKLAPPEILVSEEFKEETPSASAYPLEV